MNHLNTEAFKQFILPSKTIFVYILKEMLLYFLVTFAFFFFVFFVNNILLMAENILAKQVPLKQVLKLVFFAIPSVVATAAPFATMVGTLLALGRLASDNEIISIRALGFSYRTIFFPMIAAGLIISGASFLVNDVLLPISTIQFNKLYREIMASTPALELESNSIKKNNQTAMVIGKITKNEIDDLVIFDRDNNGNSRIIVSPNASIGKINDPSIAINLQMSETDVILFSSPQKENFDYIKSKLTEYNILFSDITGNSYSGLSPREMTSVDVAKEIKKLRKTYEDQVEFYNKDVFSALLRLDKQYRTAGSIQKWNENFTGVLSDIKTKIKKEPSDFSLNTYLMEFYLKFSLPFGSFFFILISFPLGVMIKRKGQAASLLWGILVCFFYWAILLSLQTLGLRDGLNAFVSMWTPNLLMGVLGVVLIFKVFKK